MNTLSGFTRRQCHYSSWKTLLSAHHSNVPDWTICGSAWVHNRLLYEDTANQIHKVSGVTHPNTFPWTVHPMTWLIQQAYPSQASRPIHREFSCVTLIAIRTTMWESYRWNEHFNSLLQIVSSRLPAMGQLTGRYIYKICAWYYTKKICLTVFITVRQCYISKTYKII